MDVVIKLLTEFRDEMNVRFERMEGRFEQRMDAMKLELKRDIAAVDARLSKVHGELKRDISMVHLDLTRDMAAMNARFDTRFDDVLLDRREMRTRLERCERDIDELKRR